MNETDALEGDTTALACALLSALRGQSDEAASFFILRESESAVCQSSHPQNLTPCMSVSLSFSAGAE